MSIRNSLSGLVILSTALGIGYSSWRLTLASAAASDARERTFSLTAQLLEIERLRPQMETALLQGRPTESLGAAVRAALGAAGADDIALRSLTAGSDEPVPGEERQQYRRQSINMQITPLSTKQLGLFLAAWRKAEPAWLVTRLDLSHLGPNTDSNSTYDVRLALTSTYVSARDN